MDSRPDSILTVAKCDKELNRLADHAEFVKKRHPYAPWILNKMREKYMAVKKIRDELLKGNTESLYGKL